MKCALCDNDDAIISCPTCGERYMTAQTLHELEAIKAERRRRAALRTVAVAQFPTTATQLATEIV